VAGVALPVEVLVTERRLRPNFAGFPDDYFTKDTALLILWTHLILLTEASRS
jgi:hypothetical protein